VGQPVVYCKCRREPWWSLVVAHLISLWAFAASALLAAVLLVSVALHVNLDKKPELRRETFTA
jgi:hypothetical protein